MFDEVKGCFFSIIKYKVIPQAQISDCLPLKLDPKQASGLK
jgi:hypothetical protein